MIMLRIDFRLASTLALVAASMGCSIGGTIDNIPKKQPVRVTDVHLRPPVGACSQPQSQVGGCRFSEEQCSYDERGCEVCVCMSH
jgi:hypothetical protein